MLVLLQDLWQLREDVPHSWRDFFTPTDLGLQHQDDVILKAYLLRVNHLHVHWLE